MARKREQRQRRQSRGGGRRRAVPGGLGMGLGVIALLMGLAFAAVKIRACRDEAAHPAGERSPG